MHLETRTEHVTEQVLMGSLVIAAGLFPLAAILLGLSRRIGASRGFFNALSSSRVLRGIHTAMWGPAATARVVGREDPGSELTSDGTSRVS